MAIVNAVTESYVMQHIEFGRYVNRQQTETFEKKLEAIANEIDRKRKVMNDLTNVRTAPATRPTEMLNPKTETDPAQPTLIKVTQEQFTKLIDKQFELDLAFLDALAHLDAVRSVQLKSRIEQEFKKSHKVAALIDQIEALQKLVNSADEAPSPAVIAAGEKLEKLTKVYEELWASEFSVLHRWFADEDRGLLSESTTRELEVAVERARRKKEGFAKQLGSIQIIRNEVENHSFETAYVNYQLQSLMQWEDQVRKNLEQLRYELIHDVYRVNVVEEASASKTPASSRALKYMAAAPYAVLFFLVGSFLMYEIKAGRKTSEMPD